jgi:fructan beta-fructosidase
MAVYTEAEGKRWIAFHTSPDMKAWTYRSRVEGFFECPELFEIPIDGKRGGATKWVLYGADGEYVLGEFDGRAFHSDFQKERIWHGQFYAAQTYSNVPDGRRIQIGWANGVTFPGMPFNQQMTVPHTLTLRETSEGLRLLAAPVKELEALRTKELVTLKDTELSAGNDPLQPVSAELLDLELELELRQAEGVMLTLRGVPIEYNAKTRTLSVGKHRLAVPQSEDRLHLRALVDRGSIELFAQHGRIAVSHGVLLPPENRSSSLSVKGQPAFLKTLRVFELGSAWTK